MLKKSQQICYKTSLSFFVRANSYAFKFEGISYTFNQFTTCKPTEGTMMVGCGVAIESTE